MSASIDTDGIPCPVHHLSYVRILRGFGGTYAVETLDCRPSGYLTARVRWFGSSEGRAMLVAQWFEARGYSLFNAGRPCLAR